MLAYNIHIIKVPPRNLILSTCKLRFTYSWPVDMPLSNLRWKSIRRWRLTLLERVERVSRRWKRAIKTKKPYATPRDNMNDVALTHSVTHSENREWVTREVTFYEKHVAHRRGLSRHVTILADARERVIILRSRKIARLFSLYASSIHILNLLLRRSYYQ